MRKYKHPILILFTFTALIILILDSKTAMQGVSQGISLCIKTLIPALFPFLVISSSCCSLMSDYRSSTLNILLRPCKLPNGSEIIFLIGLLGGYPVGAKLISEAYNNGRITKHDAQRMLMFCNNAGPSFIFGILGTMFSDKRIPWIIWLLHIISAYFVGILTAASPGKYQELKQEKKLHFTQIVTNSVKSMVNICSWVILFRILLIFLNKWILHILPATIRILISGILELSNGCTQISLIENAKARFIISLLIITFGGMCVTLQTASVVPELSIKDYLKGKFLQCMIVLLLSLPVLMDLPRFFFLPIILLLSVLFSIKCLQKRKTFQKSSRFS